MDKKDLQHLNREILEERFIELLNMYHHQSEEMSKINNTIASLYRALQFFWTDARSKRENYQTTEKFLLRPKDGMKWCIVCKDYVDLSDTHTITEYNDANFPKMLQKNFQDKK